MIIKCGEKCIHAEDKGDTLEIGIGGATWSVATATLDAKAVGALVDIAAAWLIARVKPGEAAGAIEPPPTAPAKDTFEHGVRDAARQMAAASGLNYAAAERVGDAALAAYRKELA